MSEKVERELRALFAEAEARGACAAPSEKRLQVACLRRTGETGTVVSSARGLFARRSWWEGLGFSEQTLAIMRAVQRRHPDWAFCGPSAALALGCDVPYAWQRPLHVLRESGNASARTALVTHHSTTLADDARERPIWHGGLHVTPLLRTVLDSLRWMSFREGMVVADWAMGACGVAWQDFVEYAYRRVGSCRDAKRALSTFVRATGLAESGGESIARATMFQLGFAKPELQVWIEDPVEPGKWFRVDFLWLTEDGRRSRSRCPTRCTRDGRSAWTSSGCAPTDA